MFIKAALASAEETEVAPGGNYDLNIINIEEVPVKKTPGASQLRATLGFTDHPNYQPFNVYVGLVGSADDEVATTRKLRNLRRFCSTFDIAWEAAGFDTDDAVGATAKEVQVTQRPRLDAEGHETEEQQNSCFFKRFDTEEGPAKKSARKRRA